MKAEFDAGKLQGEASYWFADGQVRATGSYADNQRTGNWRVWNPDGTVNEAETGYYEADRKVGPLRD